MNNFSKSTILVTGGNGAVGSHLVKRLLELEAKVTVLDDFSQSGVGNLPKHGNLLTVRGDICNQEVLKKIFRTKFDYVFHLAARFANEMSIKNPTEDMRVNIQGTLEILKNSSKQKLNRFLYTSSSSIYGNQKISGYSENSLPHPTTPYAVSKLTGEYYCNAFHELYNLDYTVIRLSNSYGPFDPPGKYRNVIPNFIHNAIDGKNLEITGDGEETRDFTYVEDCVNGILLGATTKFKNQVFNLGTGKETTINHVADLIIKYTNSKSRKIYKPNRDFDHVKRRKMKIDKAKKLLHYKPVVNFESGIEKTCNWFLQR